MGVPPSLSPLTMTPEDATAALKDAQEGFTMIHGKPTDEDTATMVNALSPILLNTPYNAANTKHNLIGLIASLAAYIGRFNVAFPRPDRTGAYDPDSGKYATVIDCSRSEGKWSDLKSDHALFESTERSVKLFITTATNETWFKELKDAELLYTDISAATFLQNIRSCSGGLHATDTINLASDMMK